MKTLYIFPHPDDESFGPAPVIYRQIQNNEEAHLLTFTKGGATKRRFKHKLSVEEMGEVRFKEMQAVEKVIGLSSMHVYDFEDGGMAHTDPRDIEHVIKKHIDEIKPDVIVTYPIHGVSMHHDHLACHAIVKRLFCELREQAKYSFLKRLAFFTLSPVTDSPEKGGNANVQSSKEKHIDCVVNLTQDERDKLKEALYCYESFIDIIESTGVIDRIGDKVYFEFFDENYETPVGELTHGL
ncbi:MAG: PIG-L family deacetylase [Crocinitomicaceae bacterium]|nr:PIG-L family deacetylase [Crocinitomicaceae bacterium]